MSNLSKLSVGVQEMFSEDTLSSVVQCRVFLQDKRHFAHTWHLFKTITGAVGLEPVGLNLHVWTQHIWGDRKATTIDQLDAL